MKLYKIFPKTSEPILVMWVLIVISYLFMLGVFTTSWPVSGLCLAAQIITGGTGAGIGWRGVEEFDG